MSSGDVSRRALRNNGRIGLPLLLLAMVVLAALGFLGWLLIERDRKLNTQLELLRLSTQVMSEKMEQAAQLSQEAYRRAGEAQQAAEEAAVSRARAEAASAQAQQRSRRALEQMRKAREEADQVRQEADRIRREREAELDRLQETLGQIVETRRTALGLVMNLGHEFIQFDFDRAVLRPEDRELLSRIAGVLLTSERYRVQIYGHTDDVGSQQYNLDLSRRRAEAVRDYLVEAGIDPGIILTDGLGKSNPLVPGVSPEARQKNRRVEIGIVDAVINFSQALSPEPE